MISGGPGKVQLFDDSQLLDAADQLGGGGIVGMAMAYPPPPKFRKNHDPIKKCERTSVPQKYEKT
jgi:hypothetical protein